MVTALNRLLRGVTDVDFVSVERSLPQQYKGRTGYTRLLRDIPLRISVSGTRGKTSLTALCEEELRARGYQTFAKQTGLDPTSIKDGARFPIRRPRSEGAMFDENIWEVKRWWQGGIDALVLENQAISAYTMRVFNHRFCRPHYLLVTNVRRDHIESLGDSMTAHAAAFGRSALRETTLISGEANENLAYTMRRECESVGARFVDAAPSRTEVHPPGYEAITVLDALLRLATRSGLETERRDTERARLARHFKWRTSSLPEVLWFSGAAVNDVDSTRTVYRWLQRSQSLPTTFVAYLRPDRRGRTASFVSFFVEGFAEGWCHGLYLAGAGSDLVASRLRRWSERVRVFDDDVSEIPGLTRHLAEECRGGAVMTVANAVPPFPRAVEAALSSDIRG